MEHTLTTTDIIINLAIQLGQIIIFFGVFVYFFGHKIATAVVERQKKEAKLAQADHEYQLIIDDAQTKAGQIIKDATHTKNNLISQAQIIGLQTKQQLLDEAHTQAGQIVEKAQQEAQIHLQELESHFESAVKKTAFVAVEKLIQTNDKATSAYLQGLVDEFTQSKNNLSGS